MYGFICYSYISKIILDIALIFLRNTPMFGEPNDDN